MFCRHSSTVRISGFHPGGRGSIPRGGIAVSSNGKTLVFGTSYWGSNPCTAAFVPSPENRGQAGVAKLANAVDSKSIGLFALGGSIPSAGMPDNDAGWSSQVARQAHILEIAGSNPAPAMGSMGNALEKAR